MLKKITAILSMLMIISSMLFVPVVGAFAYTEGTSIDANGHPSENTDIRKESPYYVDIGADRVFDPNGGSPEVSLFDGFTGLLQKITAYVLLPIGIVLSTWRCLYIASVVYIAHVDPLHVVFDENWNVKGRYAPNNSNKAWRQAKGAVNWGSIKSFTEAPTSNQYQNAANWQSTTNKSWGSPKHVGQWAASENATAKRALLVEVKNMGIGLLITFSIFSLINILIWLATIILNMVPGSVSF